MSDFERKSNLVHLLKFGYYCTSPVLGCFSYLGVGYLLYSGDRNIGLVQHLNGVSGCCMFGNRAMFWSQIQKSDIFGLVFRSCFEYKKCPKIDIMSVFEWLALSSDFLNIQIWDYPVFRWIWTHGLKDRIQIVLILLWLGHPYEANKIL